MSLKIKQLKKTMNGNEILKGIDLEIEAGTIYGFVGINGAGKTTTFRHILGIYTPDEGSVTWKENKIERLDATKVGYLPEERGLYPKRTVKQQLFFFGKLHNMTKKEIKTKIDFWLTFFHIQENLNKKISELSKGNQQKIQFIASIIHEPELIILDEPFSGLDPINSNQLKEAILYLKEQGCTVIFSSHQMTNVEEICESICMIKAGKILLEGNLNQIKNNIQKRKIIIQADFERKQLNERFGIESYNEKNDVVSFYTSNNYEAQMIQQYIFQSSVIQRFSIEPMSLNDIFLERAGE
ncbi:sodium ABC transporter ATP-binding protein [Carnobacterium divergens]|uniref:ABC transporter ATP-binding protein n=1 Tax=Carnobacterium divergens TaxID=2748 RepID=UPI001072D052|nr:ATP-binding cassette domain-containing protein [Carnobacterium divergens]TFJ44232.1 sodium ABC transporter ATP-binding protein [Carnobacterium divergens]TFJ50872.1 sodium ABC transporter ATP-binding protein [Carnobacterium divergens]